MALTFIGETEFVQSGPEQWQQNDWELDTLIVPYSGANINLDTFLDSLEKGQPSEIDVNMLLSQWRVGGSKVYPVVDLTYVGKKNGILPPLRHVKDDSVMSASSSRRSNGAALSSPLTLQYYAPTTEISFYTYDSPGTAGTVDDPTEDIRVISIIVGDTNFSPTGLLSDVRDAFFSDLIINTIQSTEIIPERLWENRERKIKTLVPFLFSITGGNYITMTAAGSGYTAGDTLTITDGTSTATMSVTAVSFSGVIQSFSMLTNTFTYATSSPLAAVGGSGTGAQFENVHVSG